MFKIEDWSVIFFLFDSNHRNSSGTTQMYWITVPWNLRHLISGAVSDWELNDKEMLRYLHGRLWRISIRGWQLSSLRTAEVFPGVASAPPKNRGREATTGNTSAVRRLTTQWLCLIYFNRWFLGVVDGYSHQMTEYKRLKIHWTISTTLHKSQTIVSTTPRNSHFT